ncbi:MAG: iron permease family protein [Amycolatopsis sp.]|uniref:iron uptake transporter permease EfeU n=1 Tax=Amycolatopsis sp. TaxID=37632 RepID=UPI0034599886|nr:iron permease family protein [Amycolatopsis sp.]
MWAYALPNLLIGLREGLEAGLVVSILVAAIRKTGLSDTPAGRRISTAPIWLGVVAAVVLALSFGAVLTFYRSILSTTGQEALGGSLSVIAVVLVTAMIFWMRRTARSLSGELRAKVATALKISTAALALTAFLAVGREGVETALFLFTAAQASGQTVAPLIGAAVGIALAVVLCVLLYRSTVRIQLGVFFNRTAALLIVIAAGVLAYGLGDLQDAGILPGHTWVAFDLSQHIDASSWWASIITGVTELSPKMTWLQVIAYVVYLASVLFVFLQASSSAPAPPPAESEPALVKAPPARRWVVTAVAAALVVPPVAAGALILFAPGKATAGSQQIQVTASACAPDWSATGAGSQSYTVVNKSGHTVEVNLVQAATQGIAAEIETLGPATQETLSTGLTTGGYFWRCLADGLPDMTSATLQISGDTAQAPPAAVKPVTTDDLQPAATAYQGYVRPKLVTLLSQVATIRVDLASGQLPAAQRDWLAAQLTWEQVGAAYDSFGDSGDAIDGLPQALPNGVNDSGFTGLHRLEYGLWHGQSAVALLPVADALTSDITTLQGKLPQLTIDPTDMPIRAHEILEDALRDHLNGLTDEGSGAAYQETYADVQGTEVVLGELEPLLTPRAPQLLPTIQRQLDTLSQALQATQWHSPASTPTAAQERVNATLGAVLENLSDVPDLLEVPAH